MTSEQKVRIQQLRDEGKTFAAISDEIGVAISTIKSFCQKNLRENVPTAKVERNTAVPAAIIDTHGFCRQCGETLDLRPGNQMKRFCSERCRQKWWREHPGLVTSKASSSVCVGCGSVFKNGGNHARRYCSRACYMTHRFGNTTCRRIVNE